MWENTYGCDEKYRRSTEIYLISILDHVYYIINYCDIGEPVNGERFLLSRKVRVILILL